MKVRVDDNIIIETIFIMYYSYNSFVFVWCLCMAINVM